MTVRNHYLELKMLFPTSWPSFPIGRPPKGLFVLFLPAPPFWVIFYCETLFDYADIRLLWFWIFCFYYSSNFYISYCKMVEFIF